MEPRRVGNDRCHERRRWDKGSHDCDQWMATDPAVQTTILSAAGDEQTDRETRERRVWQPSDPHVVAVMMQRPWGAEPMPDHEKADE